MGAILRTLLSIPIVLLPPRYRRRMQAGDLVPAAITAGAVQALGGVAWLVVGYVLYLDARVKEMTAALMALGAEHALGGHGVQFGMGTSVLLEYMFRPLTLLIVYLIVEGVVRVAAALASQEILGTLPLYLVAWAQGGLQHTRTEMAKPQRVMDQVERVQGAGHTLRIASCRPKEHWDSLMTVEYEDELYEIGGEEQGDGARPYVYLLRPKPEGKVVRGMYHYRPEEELQKD